MIATALLDSLWQGAFIVAIAAVANAIVPKHHAASKYLIWLTALAALVAVPVCTAFSPQDPYGAMPGAVVKASVATSAAVSRAAISANLWLLVAWIAGVTFGTIRLLISGIRVATMLRASRPATGFARDVRVSDRISVPVAAGFIHPVVVLPDRMMETLPAIELHALVEHERAHISRGDILTNFVARSVEALLFFNPWVYVIGRELVKQREAACDDRAVVATGAADAYAASLASAALSIDTRNRLLTPSAMGSKRLLLARIARLLAGKETVVKANYVPAAACAAAFAVLTFTLGTKGLAQSNEIADASLPANCNQSATVLVPQPPDIPKSAYADASAQALVTVDADGRPASAKIVKSSGSATIDSAAVAAAMHSTYRAKTVNCKAVIGTYLFRVDVSKK
ncbi:MAG TPA: M56 family metallopeptidase [Candidatus Tumulicola sp.]|jgi:TonB family protein